MSRYYLTILTLPPNAFEITTFLGKGEIVFNNIKEKNLKKVLDFYMVV